MSRLLLTLTIAVVALVMTTGRAAPALAATLTVCPGGPPQCQYSSIQVAINNAHTGDTIQIQAPTYTENLSIPGSGTATTLTLQGNGVTVDGHKNGSVLDVKAGHQVSVDGLTFTNGKAVKGGGVFNEGGTVTLSNCRVTDNLATNFMGAGGGINNTGTMTVRNCRISGNAATTTTTDPTAPGGRGGGVQNSGTMTLDNSPITSNTAVRGGGVGNGAPVGCPTITLTNSPITDNTASVGAGGMSNGCQATLTNSPIEGNTGGNVGGLGNSNAPETMTLTNSPVTGNRATATTYDCTAGAFGIAGGIGNAEDSSLSLLNSPVAGNRAPDVTGSAGGINNQTTCPQTNPAPPTTNGTVTFSQHGSPVEGNKPNQCLPASLC